MHKYLSGTISRLSSSEPVVIIRVSGCLPGLHPIHLYWFRTRMTDFFLRESRPAAEIEPSFTCTRVRTNFQPARMDTGWSAPQVRSDADCPPWVGHDG